MPIDQVSKLISPIQLPPPRRDINRPPLSQRLVHPKQIADAVPLIRVVLPCRLSRFRRNGQALFADQLIRALVKPHHRPPWVVRARLHIEDGFPRGALLGPHRREAPFLLLPGLDFVFFRVTRPVSSDQEAPCVSSTR